MRPFLSILARRRDDRGILNRAVRAFNLDGVTSNEPSEEYRVEEVAFHNDIAIVNPPRPHHLDPATNPLRAIDPPTRLPAPSPNLPDNPLTNQLYKSQTLGPCDPPDHQSDP